MLQPIYKEVVNKEHEVIMLLNKGRELLGRNGQRSDARNLQRDLDKIQHQWEKLKKDTVDRQTRLQTCMVNSINLNLITLIPIKLCVCVYACVVTKL